MVKEYIALAPTGPAGDPLEWISAEYPADVSSAKDVKLTKLTKTVPELGDWFGLDPGATGLALTGRIVGDTFYALLDIAGISTGGGCCADTLRMYPKSSQTAYKDIKLDPLVRAATGVTDAHVSHVTDVSMLNGVPTAFCQVKYTEEAIGDGYGDALIAVNTVTGELVPTKDGKQIFDIFAEVGTLSENVTETRFKIGFY